jgi:hypothetical protein
VHTPAMKKRSHPPPVATDSKARDSVRPQRQQQAIIRRDLASLQEWVKAHGSTLPTSSTLLELVCTVNRYTTSDVETVAVATYLINSGHVRLRGTFVGATICFPRTRARRKQHRMPDHLSKDSEHG